MDRHTETRRILDEDVRRLLKKKLPIHPFLLGNQSLVPGEAQHLLEFKENVIDEQQYLKDSDVDSDKLLLGLARPG